MSIYVGTVNPLGHWFRVLFRTRFWIPLRVLSGFQGTRFWVPLSYLYSLCVTQVLIVPEKIPEQTVGNSLIENWELMIHLTNSYYNII